ncbi:SH3 domain-containing protein [Priestia filamentosa]|uniref:SH3 domain-containing protein n=1 Tax=Priestia filamentosa TaxID=1402861 RepID=UPI0012E01439
MILAVFLGLLASSAALIASLFMLQQLKGFSSQGVEIEDLKKQINAISVDVDVSPITQRLDKVETDVNELNNSVDTLEANQFDTIKANTSEASTNTAANVGSTNTTATSNVSNTTTTTTPSTDNKSTTPKTNTTTQNVEKKPTTSTTTSKKESKVVAKTTNGLNLRSQPGLKASVVKKAGNGEKLTVVGESVSKDGYTWIKVKDSKGKTGWVAKKYTN